MVGFEFPEYKPQTKIGMYLDKVMREDTHNQQDPVKWKVQGPCHRRLKVSNSAKRARSQAWADNCFDGTTTMRPN